MSDPTQENIDSKTKPDSMSGIGDASDQSEELLKALSKLEQDDDLKELFSEKTL